MARDGAGAGPGDGCAADGGDRQTVSPAPGVRRFGPEVGPTPLVFASPHSGDLYPDDLYADPDLPQASLRSAEDALIDRIAAPAAASIGTPLLCGLFGRAYVDRGVNKPL